MRCLQLQSIQTRQQLNSPSKITFPFPPKTFSKQALVHNSQFTTLQLQNRNSNKTLNRYLCQLLKRKTISNSPIIPSNSNSNSHISLFQIKKPKSLSLSLSHYFHGLLQALNSHYQWPLCPAFWRGPRHCGTHVCWQNHRPSPPDQVWGQQWEVCILGNWGFVILLEFLLFLMFEYSF